MNVYGVGGSAPPILNLDTVNVSGYFYIPAASTWGTFPVAYEISGSMDPRVDLGTSKKPEIERQFHGHRSRSLVTILTELSGFFYCY
jgi:hypothetical protein